MKRVKMFLEEYNDDIERLEKRVNDFLATLMPEKVLDIQYRDCDSSISVMVVYEDERTSYIAAAPDPFTMKPRTFEDIYGGSR